MNAPTAPHSSHKRRYYETTPRQLLGAVTITGPADNVKARATYTSKPDTKAKNKGDGLEPHSCRDAM